MGADKSNKSTQFGLSIIFGRDACQFIDMCDKIPDEDELWDLGGETKEVFFNTKEERMAYIQGLEDAKGWPDVYFTLSEELESSANEGE